MKKTMLKSWLKKILIISLELILISGALWYVVEKKSIKIPSGIIPAIQQTVLQTAQKIENVPEKAQQQTFPAYSSPVTRTFNWNYKGTKYSLSETLYISTYNYYKSQPKTFSYNGDLPSNWEDDYYGMFLKSNAGDTEIAQLANDLQGLGKKHNLSSDQIIELTMAFIQSITYDDARAKEILSKTGDAKMQYPYETLYLQLGVCSDKSLLATTILRQMNYGVALFAYEQDNHMAIGIQCSKDSSTYGSGYCFAETTSIGNKIGIIPSFDVQSNKTSQVEQLSTFETNQTQQSNLQQLGEVTMFQKTSGKEYMSFAITQKNMTEIVGLKKNIDASLPQLNILKKNMSKEESNLKSMQNDLDGYQKSQNIGKYNALASEYNNLLQTYQKDAKKYNESVTLYNQTIARYNTLIKQ